MALFWSLFFVSPAIVASTFLHGVVSLVAALFDSSGRVQFKVARVWGRSLLWITGVKVEAEGLDRLLPGVPYVLVANHLSYMDTPVLLPNVPGEFRFLAKSGLFQIPFMGWHLHRAGHIPPLRHGGAGRDGAGPGARARARDAYSKMASGDSGQ